MAATGWARWAARSSVSRGSSSLASRSVRSVSRGWLRAWLPTTTPARSKARSSSHDNTGSPSVQFAAPPHRGRGGEQDRRGFRVTPERFGIVLEGIVERREVRAPGQYSGRVPSEADDIFHAEGPESEPGQQTHVGVEPTGGDVELLLAGPPFAGQTVVAQHHVGRRGEPPPLLRCGLVPHPGPEGQVGTEAPSHPLPGRQAPEGGCARQAHQGPAHEVHLPAGVEPRAQLHVGQDVGIGAGHEHARAPVLVTDLVHVGCRSGPFTLAPRHRDPFATQASGHGLRTCRARRQARAGTLQHLGRPVDPPDQRAEWPENRPVTAELEGRTRSGL